MAHQLKQLRWGNDKVGASRVLQFSLPAGRPEEGGTCPGATHWCAGRPDGTTTDERRGNCFAKTGWYVRRRSLIQALQDRRAWLLQPGGYDRLVREVCEDLSNKPTIRHVRLHISGDFFSPAYCKAWVAIRIRNPDRFFWGYTRSWTQPDLLPHLEVLRRLPNVQLFASTDPSMDLPPPGWRIAATARDDIKGLRCPHDKGAVEACVPTCLFCTDHALGEMPVQMNVIFTDKRLLRAEAKLREGREEAEASA